MKTEWKTLLELARHFGIDPMHMRDLTFSGVWFGRLKESISKTGPVKYDLAWFYMNRKRGYHGRFVKAPYTEIRELSQTNLSQRWKMHCGICNNINCDGRECPQLRIFNKFVSILNEN